LSDLPKGENEEEKNNQIKNAYSIINKIEEIRMIYKEINDNEILEELKNLKEIMENNKIELNALGSLTFNSIENNLCSLLNLIIDEFDKKKDENLLNNFGLIFNEIYESFKSVKLLFLFIKFLSSHSSVSEFIKIDTNKSNQFISEKSLNFDKICNERNLTKKIDIDFKLFLKDEEVSNKNLEDFSNYYTLNYEDDLFVFLNPNKFENVDDEKNKKEDEKDKSEDEKDRNEEEEDKSEDEKGKSEDEKNKKKRKIMEI
jgi:biopolymer transport protein ExbD